MKVVRPPRPEASSDSHSASDSDDGDHSPTPAKSKKGGRKRPKTEDGNYEGYVRSSRRRSRGEKEDDEEDHAPEPEPEDEVEADKDDEVEEEEEERYIAPIMDGREVLLFSVFLPRYRKAQGSHFQNAIDLIQAQDSESPHHLLPMSGLFNRRLHNSGVSALV